MASMEVCTPFELRRRTSPSHAPSMEKPVSAAIYSRISHDPAERALGVERQEQDCRALIARNGWLLAGEPYRENDTSASTRSTAKRPVYERMLTDVAAGLVDVVVAYSTSRLTRRPLDYERLISLVQTAGLRIATVMSGAVDLSTADGRAVARILAAMDAAEAERAGERIARAARQRAEQGRWHGGPIPPFGYRFATRDGIRVLDIDETRAELVREAAARVLAGESLYRIRRDWNARGLLSSAGRPWRSQGVRLMLVRGAAAGFAERDGELLAGSWQPILDEATWRQTRQLLTDPARNTRSFEQRSHRYPLSGLLFCGLCGQRLSASIMRYGLTYWCPEGPGGGCGHVRIRGGDTERYLLEATARHLRERRSDSGDDPVLDALRGQLHQLQDDHYDRLLDRSDYVRQTGRLQQRIANRRRQLTAGPPVSGPRRSPVTIDEPEEMRRAFLRGHLARVDVGRHPPGSTRPPPSWPDRAAKLAARLRLHWHRDEGDDGPDTPQPAPAETAPPDRLDAVDQMAASSRWR